MSKSAIYATVKTVDELILPFAGGMLTVVVFGQFGFWNAAGAFVLGVSLNLAFKYLSGWFLKKMGIPNY